jgi:predicted DNA-binding transcriptional regulator AlpA
MSVETASTLSINFDSPLWRLPTVLAFVPISQSTWLSGVSRGDMPKPVKIPGTKAVAWRADEVRAWVNELQPLLNPSEQYLGQVDQRNQCTYKGMNCLKNDLDRVNLKV